jgi:FkbM family methyltransferase
VIFKRFEAAAGKYPLIKKLFRPVWLATRLWGRLKRKSFQRFCQRLHMALAQDPVVRSEQFRGDFSMDVRSHLFRSLQSKDGYEAESVSCCQKHLDIGRDAIDAGSNIGLFTVLLARMLTNNKVLSIEPTAGALKRLYRNIRANQVEENVIVFAGAVLDCPGSTRMKVVEGKEEYSSVGKLVHPSISGEKSATENVQVSTIDELVARYSLDPGFLKIDTEGSGFRVLSGASSVLANNRPVILAELSDPLLRANGSCAADVLSLLAGYEYDISDLLLPHARPGALDYGNIICVPRERNSMIASR